MCLCEVNFYKSMSAAVNFYCHRAGGSFLSVSSSTVNTATFLLKIALSWSTFKIGTLEEVAVAALDLKFQLFMGSELQYVFLF